MLRTNNTEWMRGEGGVCACETDPTPAIQFRGLRITNARSSPPHPPVEWVVYTITDRIEHVASTRSASSSKNRRGIQAARRERSADIYTPTKTSDHFFLRFPEMLQGGHLLSWYHEILHALLSPVCHPPPHLLIKKEKKANSLLRWIKEKTKSDVREAEPPRSHRGGKSSGSA